MASFQILSCWKESHAQKASSEKLDASITEITAADRPGLARKSIVFIFAQPQGTVSNAPTFGSLPWSTLGSIILT
jgi:hypothetical protein